MKRKEQMPTEQNFCLRVDEMIQEMCEKFVDKYFWEDADMFIVWADLPGIMAWPLFVNDYYFSLEDVYAALWYDMPFDCLIEYQDYKDDVMYNGATDYNLKSFYHLIYMQYADQSSEEKGWTHTRSSYWWDEADLLFRGRTDITLTATTEPVKCRSVKFSVTDDSDDEPAMRDDEDDGWKNEKIRGAECCEEERTCSRTRGCRSVEWRQCSKLQQRGRGRVRWSNK